MLPFYCLERLRHLTGTSEKPIPISWGDIDGGAKLQVNQQVIFLILPIHFRLSTVLDDYATQKDISNQHPNFFCLSESAR